VVYTLHSHSLELRWSEDVDRRDSGSLIQFLWRTNVTPVMGRNGNPSLSFFLVWRTSPVPLSDLVKYDELLYVLLSVIY